MAQPAFLSADLAPGDLASAAFDRSRVTVQSARSGDDAIFQEAYRQLWAQFGASHEMESREVLARRLMWAAATCRDGYAMRYELLLVRSGASFAAARDHTAIATTDSVVVHLSHLLVAPAWRRTGLAGWLRAFPIQTARDCLEAAGLPRSLPITLVAEMEYPDHPTGERAIRLRAYEKAGFRKVDPASVRYRQPDFRSPAEIDATGVQALPFQLVLRRVGREAETQISACEVRSIVARLYAMYQQAFRPEDLRELWRDLDSYPPHDASVALLPPTASC